MFLRGKLFGIVTGQKVLEFFIVGPKSDAVPLYESWARCFVWVDVGVYHDGLGLFFFLFLILFDSSVSILSRRFNLFLVSAIWFRRVDTFSCSRPVDDVAWSILDCKEHSCLSQFSSRFALSNLDEGGRIGDQLELSFADDFLLVGSSLDLSCRVCLFVFWLVILLWLFHWLFLYLHWLVLFGFEVQPSTGSSVVLGTLANHSVPAGSISPWEPYICYLDWLYPPSMQQKHSCFCPCSLILVLWHINHFRLFNAK